MSGPPILSVDGANGGGGGSGSATLAVSSCSTTPRTPEILNSVIAMTNPLEYSFPSSTQSTPATITLTSANISATAQTPTQVRNQDDFWQRENKSTNSTHIFNRLKIEFFGVKKKKTCF